MFVMVYIALYRYNIISSKILKFPAFSIYKFKDKLKIHYVYVIPAFWLGGHCSSIDEMETR